MNRIFLPEDVLKSSSSRLTGDWHRQVSVVLRSRPGVRFTAVCGDGFEYVIEIGHISSKETQFTILEKKEKNAEPSVAITLYISCLKANGLEEILAPLVYLGVSRVIPVMTERCQVRADTFSKAGHERIRRIIQRATALSGRTRLMACSDPVPFPEALSLPAKDESAFFFWEAAETIPLRKHFQSLSARKTVSLFTGPEGGFTGEEARSAREAGFIHAALGPRILDARTAPLVVASALLYETGDI